MHSLRVCNIQLAQKCQGEVLTVIPLFNQRASSAVSYLFIMIMWFDITSLSGHRPVVGGIVRGIWRSVR